MGSEVPSKSARTKQIIHRLNNVRIVISAFNNNHLFPFITSLFTFIP